MVNILVGLTPALMWGILPILMQKIGGRPGNQQMGMVMGTLLFAIIMLGYKQPEVWTLKILLSSFICGLIWSIAMITQITTYNILGVSVTMPFTTGLQIIGSTLVGVVYFNEWSTAIKLILGVSAIAIIITGVVLTTYTESGKRGSKTAQSDVQRGAIKNKKGGIVLLLVSSLLFVIWASIPRFAQVNGWDGNLPLSVGMFIGTFIFCLLKKDIKIWDKSSFKNILTGIVFAIGCLSMMLSNEYLGIAVGFTLSQMGVIVNTLGGLLFLKEKKSKRELAFVLTGLVFVVCGGVSVGMTKM